MQFCATMVLPPHVIISFGVLQLYFALPLRSENLSQMAIHAGIRSGQFPKTNQHIWA